MESALDSFLAHAVWGTTRRDRMIPLAEAARSTSHRAGEVLFKQFHPAIQFSLLWNGGIGHEARADDGGESWCMGRMDWRWAAVGWSGFLRPFRYGTSARALTDVELLTWHHESLATLFYADPALAVNFFRLILDSACRQFESLRESRVAAAGTLAPQVFGRAIATPPPSTTTAAVKRRFAPDVLAVLRRSAFFELFEDSLLEPLAAHARLVRKERGQLLVCQDEDTQGIWLLGAGRATGSFTAGNAPDRAPVRFRTIPEHGGIAAGIPTLANGWRAEATVVADSTCWFHHLPAAALEQFIGSDPEFGRAFMQRHLVRLAHLIATARLPRHRGSDEPEVASVRSLLDHAQTRIPVTSALHQVPHLLSNKLTAPQAMTCLDEVRRNGAYEERAIARACTDLLTNLRSELRFYQDVLATYEAVASAAPDTPPATLRARCDDGMVSAFSHLRTEIHRIGLLPEQPGHIVIINHLACPVYYQLPNGCHFSFDTAFVSVLLQSVHGISPIRVVRQSPGDEYGHNLFYERLGHISVPTPDSGLDATPAAMQRMRREAAELLFTRGTEALARGDNVLICPEGRSQLACDSPARFYSGAFRLALKAEVEPLIVPIALAGFDRRYRDAKLVAVVQRPFRVSEALRRRGNDDLRAFLDAYRGEFAGAVAEAQRLSRISPGAPAPAPANAETAETVTAP